MDYYFYVGCYTKDPGGKGIHLLRFDTEAGKLSHADAYYGAQSPSFLIRHGDFLYAANESGGAGRASALKIGQDRSLTYLNTVEASGAGTCQVAEMNGYLYGACYSSGTVFGAEILRDGSLGKITADIQHEGSGPVPGRQQNPHAHSVNPVPGSDMLIAADLGADRLFCYRQQKDGSLTLEAAVPSPPGAGPRHMAFSPDGKRVYVAMELSVTVCCYEISDSGLEFEAEYPLTIGAPDKGDSAADIHFTADGTKLFATVRGKNLNTVFSAGEGGKLEWAGTYPTCGDSPRNFCLTPCEKYAVTANQASGHITVCPIGEGGAIGEMIDCVVLPAPSCVIGAE
ncbi:MAG: lactonase family protein [Oscillospiraceae bacterium]|nr:lactonase family protein [Oscillospiraceae bacterium]